MDGNKADGKMKDIRMYMGKWSRMDGNKTDGKMKEIWMYTRNDQKLMGIKRMERWKISGCIRENY